MVLIEASVIDDEGLSDDWAGTFTMSAASPVLVIGDPIPVEEGENWSSEGRFSSKRYPVAPQGGRNQGERGSLPIDLDVDGRFSHEIAGEVGTVTIRVIADCGSDTTQTEFLATWLEGDNAGALTLRPPTTTPHPRQMMGVANTRRTATGMGPMMTKTSVRGMTTLPMQMAMDSDGCDDVPSKYNSSDMLEFWQTIPLPK